MTAPETKSKTKYGKPVQFWLHDDDRNLIHEFEKVLLHSPNTHPSLTTKFTSEQTAIAIPFAAR
jgi:hypothetical protein